MYNPLKISVMGKNVGLLGGVSGKVGNMVFAVQNGVQTVRQWQPIVSNPKSPAQMRQRAKGNLVGRTSSFVPAGAIMGLGANGRARRGAFMRNLLLTSVVTMVEGEYRAKLVPEAVLFSKGAVLPSFRTATLNNSGGIVAVTLEGLSGDVMPEEEYLTHATRLVVLVFRDDNGELVSCNTVLAETPEQGQTAETFVPLGFFEASTAYVYAVPMRLDAGASLRVTSDMVFLSDGDFIAGLGFGAGEGQMSYGNSVLLGSATTDAD